MPTRVTFHGVDEVANLLGEARPDIAGLAVELFETVRYCAEEWLDEKLSKIGRSAIVHVYLLPQLVPSSARGPTMHVFGYVARGGEHHILLNFLPSTTSNIMPSPDAVVLGPVTREALHVAVEGNELPMLRELARLAQVAQPILSDMFSDWTDIALVLVESRWRGVLPSFSNDLFRILMRRLGKLENVKVIDEVVSRAVQELSRLVRGGKKWPRYVIESALWHLLNMDIERLVDTIGMLRRVC